jgi:hypothetical protein
MNQKRNLLLLSYNSGSKDHASRHQAYSGTEDHFLNKNSDKNLEDGNKKIE